MDPLIENLADYFGELVEKSFYTAGLDDAIRCHPLESLGALVYLSVTGKFNSSNPNYHDVWSRVLDSDIDFSLKEDVMDMLWKNDPSYRTLGEQDIPSNVH